MTEVAFAVTSQIPLFYYFPLSKRKSAIHFRMCKQSFTSTKFAMTDLFASLLRLTTAPCANRCSFSTFTHNDCNVMRGRRLSLRHSVKHYETLRFNNTRCFIVPFFDSAAKIQNIMIQTKKQAVFYKKQVKVDVRFDLFCSFTHRPVVRPGAFFLKSPRCLVIPILNFKLYIRGTYP